MTLLSTSALSFRYKHGEDNALCEISTDIRPEERIGLMGSSGAGKSTLLLSFNGLIPHQIRGSYTGEVRVKGKKTTEGTVGQFAETVGLVFQDFDYQLLASTVELEIAFGPESLGLPREEIGRRIDWALSETGLTPLRHRTTRTLSGGEKQRLAIAAVLAMHPGLLCMDEATTDLDPAGKETILDLTRGLTRKGSTLLVVEHEADAFIGYERLLLMDRGRLIADGPADRLLRDAPLLRRARLRPPQTIGLFEALGRPERPIELDEAERLLTASGSIKGLQPIPEDPPPSGEVVIEVSGLVGGYGPRPVLRGVDLILRRGECLAIVGPNGSGKSTLLKHLNGLLLPNGGEVRFGTSTLRPDAMADLCERVGYVFQNPDHQIFANTVFEEAAFGLHLRKHSPLEIDRRVEAALDRVGLWSKAQADPFVLTRGERQRLAVASILVTAPEILLLDEPTTGLDGGEIDETLGLIRRLRGEGATVVMVTHDLRLVAEEASRILVLKEGRILFDGPPRQAFFDDVLMAEAALVPPPMALLSRRMRMNALTLSEWLTALESSRDRGLPRGL